MTLIVFTSHCPYPSQCMILSLIFACVLCAQSLSCVWFFETSWTVAHQAPLSMGFSQQEYWSGLPFPPPGDLLHPGIEPESPVLPALAGRFFTTSTNWEAPVFDFLARIPGMGGSFAISPVQPVAKWTGLAFLFFVVSTAR